MTFAALGISIEGRGLDDAPRKLDAVTAAATRAEKATDRLAPASKSAGEGVRSLGDRARTTDGALANLANRSLTGFNAIAARAAEQAAHMAREVERLSMTEIRGADIAAYGEEMDRLRAKFNPLFAASKQYETSLDEINRAHTLGAISAQEQGAAIARLDAQYEAAARAANTLTAANKSMAGSYHTTNLMFQLQDVGMMAGLGQNPVATMLQQGPQIAGVFQQIGNGRQIVQSLGSAFLSLISPISLATLAAVGLGTAGVQALMSWLSQMGPVRRSMEEHREWLNGILRGYDDLSQAVNDYIDKASRLPANLARLEIADGLNDDIERLKVVQSMIDNIRIRDDALIQLPGQTLNNDLAVLREFKSQLDLGEISAADFAEKMRLITLNRSVDGEVRRLARSLFEGGQEASELQVRIEAARNSIIGLTDQAERATAQMSLLRSTFDMLGAGAGQHGGLQAILDGQTDALKRLQAMVPDIRTGQQRAAEELAAALQSPSQALRDEAQAAYDLYMKNEAILEARRAADRGAKSGIKERDAYADLTRGAHDFIAAQQLEQQALGMTAEAAARLRYEQDLLNKAANDNIKLTPLMRDELRGLAADMAAAEAETRRQQDTMAMWDSAAAGLANVLKDGKIELQEMLGLALKLAVQFAQINNIGGFGQQGNPLATFATSLLGGIGGFSNGGSGLVGGSGTYTPGAPDNTLFVAKAQRGEPYAFGRQAMTGLAGGKGGNNAQISIQNHYTISGTMSDKDVGNMVRASNEQTKAEIIEGVKRGLPGWNASIQAYGAA